MSPAFQTPQESFWAGDFGTEYMQRNCGEDCVAANTAMFSKILSRVGAVASVLELGANIGNNLESLRYLLPHACISALDINPQACEVLRSKPTVVNEVFEGSLLSWQPHTQHDLTFTKGVLIHVNPEELHRAYDLLVNASKKWVLVAEYYNPSPVKIGYRGHSDHLFKRDFAGEIMERHPGLKLRDYGFVYRRDPVFPQDDLTWFLMEKT